ncbi:MAG: Sec-independent protein translocase protein TatB [Gammaproteobacteria bacterium]|jgi:sec-independent protein translocase protein TatB|nr:Sec-independent protein translocase protein TatB [Gammaproteobacteria bacterium]
MFDIGFSELVLIGLLGLLVLGPERLPAVARQIGRYVGRARSTWNQMRTELEREIDQTGIKDIKKDIDSTSEELQKSMQESKKSLDETRKSVDQSIQTTADKPATKQSTQTGDQS